MYQTKESLTSMIVEIKLHKTQKHIEPYMLRDPWFLQMGVTYIEPQSINLIPT